MKLHPLSILYQIVAGRGLKVVNFVISILLITPFLLGPGTDAQSIRRLLFAAGGFVVVFVVYVGWELLYYQLFRYDLIDGHIEIRSGVLFRRSREIPVHRIQNVDVNRGFLQRVLGLSEVRIESAGGGETEIVLQCVSKSRGEQLRDQLRRTRKETGESESVKEDDQHTSEQPSSLYSLSSESFVLLCILSLNLGVLSWMVFSLPVVLLFAINQTPGFLPGEGIIVLLLTAMLGAVAVLAAWGIAAATTFAKYYGFQLLKFEDSLRFERGLIQRRSGSIPLDKVQKLIIRENVLMRMFGFASLEVETAGYAPGESTEREAVIPLARLGRVLKVARLIESFPELRFQRPPNRTRHRYTCQYTFAVLLLTAASFLGFYLAGLFSTSVPVIRYLWLVPLCLLPGTPLAAYLKWYHIGYLIGENYCIMRRGFWNRATMVVPYYRVQTTISSQSIFQRFWDLRSLIIDTAGSYGLARVNATATDLDDSTVERIELDVRSRFKVSLARHRKRVLEKKTKPRSKSEESSDPHADNLKFSDEHAG